MWNFSFSLKVWENFSRSIKLLFCSRWSRVHLSFFNLLETDESEWLHISWYDCLNIAWSKESLRTNVAYKILVLGPFCRCDRDLICVICLKQLLFPNTSSLYPPWSQKVGNIIQPSERQQSVCGFQASSDIFHFHPRVLFYRYPDLCMSGCVCGGSCLCRFTNRLLRFLQCCCSVLLACKLVCDQLLLQNYKVRGNAYQQLHTSLT